MLSSEQYDACPTVPWPYLVASQTNDVGPVTRSFTILMNPFHTLTSQSLSVPGTFMRASMPKGVP